MPKIPGGINFGTFGTARLGVHVEKFVIQMTTLPLWMSITSAGMGVLNTVGLYANYSRWTDAVMKPM